MVQKYLKLDELRVIHHGIDNNYYIATISAYIIKSWVKQH
jgi:hypothetical protein